MLVEDLAITYRPVATGDERMAGISIKGDRQVTATGFPANFVAALWAQWLGVGTTRPLAGRNDALVLLTGQLAQMSKPPGRGFSEKRSGLGRENGEDAIYEYLQQKSVWISPATEVPNPFVMRRGRAPKKGERLLASYRRALNIEY